MKMKEKKIRKTWKGILCLVIIVMMLCGSTMVFAETGELTTQCIDANAFISDPWGTVGNAISNGISNGVNALRYGDLYRRYGDFLLRCKWAMAVKLLDQILSSAGSG